MILPRQRPPLLAIFFAVALLFLLQARFPNASRSWPSPQSDLMSGDLQVAVINAPQYHFEVVLPLLHAFSRQERVSHLELVATPSGLNRFNVMHCLTEIVDPALRFLILTRCLNDISEEEYVGEAVERVLSTSPQSIAICVLHDVQEWQYAYSKHRQFVSNWGPKGRVKFMVLSEHVKTSLEMQLKGWDTGDVEILSPFVPVFPVSHKVLGTDHNKAQQKSIAIPGKYESWRRSCQSIFDSIAERVVEFELTKASLHLVGFGQYPSPIDPSIKDLVHFHEMLDLDTYWATLSSSLATAPAFANVQYHASKASSGVPMALIVGVPLLCNKEVLNAYSYLREEDVWLLEPGETVADGFLRVLTKSSTEWAKKRKRVVKAREKLEMENIRQVSNFLSHFVERVQTRFIVARQ